jgi:hypothetical protein
MKLFYRFDFNYKSASTILKIHNYFPIPVLLIATIENFFIFKVLKNKIEDILLFS